MPLSHPATRTDSPFTAQSSRFKIQSVHRVINGRIFKPFETSAIVRREDRREQELGKQLLRQISHSNPLCFHELKLEQLFEKKIARQIGNEMLVNKRRRYRPYGPRSLNLQTKETKKDAKKETLEEWIRRQQREDQQEAQKRAQQFESLRQNRLTERKKQEPFYMEPGPVQRPKQPYEREKFIHKAEKDTKKRAKQLARFFLIRAMEREAGAYQLIIWEQQRGNVPAEEWLKKNMALVAKIPGMPPVPPSRPQSQGRPSSGQCARNSTNGARMPHHSCTCWIFDGLNANGNATWYCVRDDYDPLLAQQFTQQPLNSGPQPQPHNPSVPSDTSSHPNPRGPCGYAAQNIGRKAGRAAGEQERQKEAANTPIQDSFSQQRGAPKMTVSSGRAYAESMRQQQDAGRTAYEAEQLNNQGNAPSSRDKYFQQKEVQEEAARAARDQPRRQNFESSGEAFRRHRKARKRKEWADRLDAEGARQQQDANRPREPAGWAYQENLRTQERIRQANQQREEAQRRFEEGKRQQRQEQQEWVRRKGRRTWDGRTPNNQFPFTFPNQQRPTAQHQNPQPVQRWEAYQAAWEKVTVGSDFPWPVQTNRSQNISPTTVNHFYTSAFPEKSHRVAVLNKERKRWHPDKVEQKVGRLGGTTLNTVRDVFQIVDELFGRETGRQVRSTGLKED